MATVGQTEQFSNLNAGTFVRSVQEWMREFGGQEEILVLSQEAAKEIAAKVASGLGLQKKDDSAYGGQKDYEATKYFTPEALDISAQGLQRALENGRGFVGGETDSGILAVRAQKWWLPQDRQANWEIPNYAISRVPLSQRTLEGERELWNKQEPGGSSHGMELEMQAITFNENGDIEPVDIQSLIVELKKYGFPLSIEGWVSQLEYVSMARQPQESLEDYRNRIAKDLKILSMALAEHDIYLAPVGVMVGSGDGQANFNNPHVQNVMRQMVEDQDLQKAAETLGLFRTSGLHITVELKRAFGQKTISAELLREVFDHTHSAASFLMKVFSRSGNLGFPDYQGKLKATNRERERLHLPTARVGDTRSLLDSNTIEDFENGAQPSLERAALLAESGGHAPHNPLGRMKQAGRNEYTMFDATYDLDLIVNLEAFLRLHTAVIHRAVLRGDFRSENLAQLLGIKDDEYNMFFTLLSNQDQFERVVNSLEIYGVNGVFEYNGQAYNIKKVLERFFDTMLRFAKYVGFQGEDLNEARSAVDFLKERLNLNPQDIEFPQISGVESLSEDEIIDGVFTYLQSGYALTDIVVALRGIVYGGEYDLNNLNKENENLITRVIARAIQRYYYQLPIEDPLPAAT